MTGQELYEMFRTENSSLGCDTDPWADIDEHARLTWDGLASRVIEKLRGPLEK